MNVQDGLDNLLDAARLIIQERHRDDIQFVLVGGGPELARLSGRVAKMGLGDYVVFAGWLSEAADLGAILATADVCVSPDGASQMNDISTMNKVLEYMALGKPIVQFDLHEGHVSAGEASLYAVRDDVASLADCIIRLIDDTLLRTQMGQLGRHRLTTTLSWESQVPHLLAGYRRAMRCESDHFSKKGRKY
jgi:glycosyltransferase involved in cell wall biosynthesis